MTEYAAGTPIWIDVSSPDLDRTRDFYSRLLGWEAQQAAGPEAGSYTMMLLDGKMAAGAMQTFSPDQHPAWSTYIRSDDAQATAQRVRDAGGEVIMGPDDVMGQGNLAVFRDPAGAFIGIWEPKEHRGVQVANQPGSFSWSELYTRDMPAAREFYGKVFGWESEDTNVGEMPYTLFKLDGRAIAGGIDMTTMLPESVPPHWLVYFTVEDTDRAVEQVKEMGGKILAGPQPTPMGPMAVIEDPVGPSFAVIQINEQSA
ncbi:MAG TPA: VOC family protein [Chloroflexota bacterium]|nr:VOC family protein [Chloroflexota bacterium]